MYNKDDLAENVIWEQPRNDKESASYINSVVIKENGGIPITTTRGLPDVKTIVDIVKANAIRYKSPRLGRKRNSF